MSDPTLASEAKEAEIARETPQIEARLATAEQLIAQIEARMDVLEAQLLIQGRLPAPARPSEDR